MMRKDILHHYAKYIESELGIVYGEHNFFGLEHRLEQIAKQMGVASIEELYEKTQTNINGSFKDLLLDFATNNETSFFRDPKVFDVIENSFIKAQLDKIKNFKIWSAASSTGQEALSIAMMIFEVSEKLKARILFSIYATDISDRVLEKAKSGIYTQLEVQRGLPATYLAKYFQKTEDNQWKVSSKVLDKIEFKKQNLKEPFSHKEKFHLILCRNVLIYQSIEGKKEILSRIISALEPGGFLVLGAGESLYGISNDFEQVSQGGAIIYRKKTILSQTA